MAGDVIARASVELTANAGQVASTFADVKAGARQTAAAFSSIGGVAGKTGEVLALGLKKGTKDLVEFASAAGLAGGKIAKISAGAADLALTGFNPLAIGALALGTALGFMAQESQKASEVHKELAAQAATANRELRQLKVEIDDLRNGTNNSGLQKYRDDLEEAENALKQFGDRIDRYQGRAYQVVQPFREDVQLAVNKFNAAAMLLEKAQEKAREQSLANERKARDAETKASEQTVEQFVREVNERKLVSDATDDIARSIMQAQFAYDRLRSSIKGLTDEQASALDAANRDNLALLRSSLEAKKADADRKALIDQIQQENAAYVDRVLADLDAEADARTKAIQESIQKQRDRLNAEIETEADIRELQAAQVKDQRDMQRALTELAGTGSDDRMAIARAAEQRELDAVDAHFRELLESMREHGVNETQLVLEIEEAKTRIRAQAARDRALHGDDFAEGMRAQAELSLASLATLGELGAKTTLTLQEGFGDLFVGMKDGAKGAEQAVLHMLTNIQDAFLRFAGNQVFGLLAGALLPAGQAGGAAAMRGSNPPNPTYAQINEGVGIVKKAPAPAGERFKVELHDHVGVDARAESGGVDADGTERVLVFLEKRMAGRVRAGGELQQAIEQTNGTRRVPRRR